jgi:Bacterial Ig-like domain (group 3)
MFKAAGVVALALAISAPSAVGVASAAEPQIATTVAVAASPTVVQEGGLVVAQATVKTTAGAVVKSGTVKFVVGDVFECQSVSATVNASGVASATVEMVTVEDGSINAYYQGDTTYAPSTASITVRVDPIIVPTSLGLTASAGYEPGRVLLKGDGEGPWHWSCGYYDQPSEGPVEFYEGTRLLGSGISSDWAGEPAELSVALSAGVHQVRAVFTPNPMYALASPQITGYTSSSSTALVTVAANAVSMTSELIRNPSFETGVASWASQNAKLASQARAGAPDGAAVGKVSRTAGTVYSLTDEQPTVIASTAGATFVAGASVAAASSSAVGKPVTLIVRERTPAGATVKETKAKTTLSNAFKRLGLAVKPSASGNTLGLRLEQGSAGTGNAFFADSLGLRHASQVFGAPGYVTTYQMGTPWTGLTSNAKRASAKNVPSAVDVPSMFAYLDGKGASSGTQSVKGVIYSSANGEPGALVASTAAVTVTAGRAAGYVELPFASPIRLAAGDYWFGLISSGTSGVARYLAQDQDAGLRTNLDTYSDGASKSFGTASSGPKAMLLHVVGG